MAWFHLSQHELGAGSNWAKDAQTLVHVAGGCDLHPLPAARRLVQARGCKEPCDHVGPKVREEAAALARGPEVKVAAVRWLVAGLEPTWPSEVGDAVARDEELSRRHDAHTRCALLLQHAGRLWVS